MKRIKYFYFILGGVFILIIIVMALVLLSNSKSGMNNYGETEKFELENGVNEIDEKNENRASIENYLKDNISSLSPEKEVMGGKFYITNISWLGSDRVRVEYEDGHIALRAEVVAKVENNEEVEIMSFNIIPNLNVSLR